MTIHRIWETRGDKLGIVWFEKQPDGSAAVRQTYVSAGKPLFHYVETVRMIGIDTGAIDYVRHDALARDIRGVSMFDAMLSFGLNPEVLPTPAWRSPTPFAEAAA